MITPAAVLLAARDTATSAVSELASDVASATADTATPVSTTTSAVSSPTATQAPREMGSQAPFLYFIALGLGIVFTNVWIILGLKYCFRRRRERLMMERGEVGSFVMGDMDDYRMYVGPLMAGDMQPRRRRRTKRLLKLDELNERFPVVKYKEWVAQRERAGLDPHGGISEELAAAVPAGVAPSEVQSGEQRDVDDSEENHQQNHEQSRPQSRSESRQQSRQQSRVATRAQTPAASRTGTPRQSMDIAPGPAGEHVKEKAVCAVSSRMSSRPSSCVASPRHSLDAQRARHSLDMRRSLDARRSFESQKSAEEQHNQDVQRLADEIRAAEEQRTPDDEHADERSLEDGLHETLVPPDLADSSGGICAICIDGLEPDNDVRALGCNHVFHDECITPWLTTRRASCPLCKKDFYIPREPDPVATHEAALQPPPPLVFLMHRHAHHRRQQNERRAAATQQDASDVQQQPQQQEQQSRTFGQRFLSFLPGRRPRRQPDVEMQAGVASAEHDNARTLANQRQSMDLAPVDSHPSNDHDPDHLDLQGSPSTDTARITRSNTPSTVHLPVIDTNR